MHARLLFRLFQSHGLARFIMGLLTVGLLILADTLATMILAAWIGAYLALAASALAMWASLLLMWGSLSRHTGRIRAAAIAGLYPEVEFMHVAGLLVSTFLVVLPGFVTDLLAWAIYLPPFRIALGAILYKSNEADFQAVYEDMQVSR